MGTYEGIIPNELYTLFNSFITSFDVQGTLLKELISVATTKDKYEYILSCLTDDEADKYNFYSIDIHMTSDVFNDILEDSNPTHYEIKEETIDSEYVELIKKPIGDIVLDDI